MTNVPGKGDRNAQYERRYKERRHWLNSIKIARGCKDCGLWGPPEVLQFDHVRGEKEFNIGPSWNQGRMAIEAEIEKCEVVCANCHAIRTKQRLHEPEFIPFPKIPRWSREIIITEKIDGTNGTVWVDGDGDVWAASRTRWLPRGGEGDDNYGFARWVYEHEDEFRELGPCRLDGEWWGSGIQRKYGLTNGQRIFSLFDTRWAERENKPACCGVVPVIYRGILETDRVEESMRTLRTNGSFAAPGFMNPEGIIIWHSGSGQYYKKTYEKDQQGKGE